MLYGQITGSRKGKGLMLTDSCQLLHHLQSNSAESTSKIAGRASKSTMEAVGPRSKVSGLRHDAQFIFVVGNDFRKLILNILRLDWLSSDAGKSTGGIVESTFFHEVTRRLRQQEETSAKNKSPEELDGHGNSVRAGIIAPLCGVDDTIRKENTDCDAELVTSHESSTNFLRGNLRHVKDDCKDPC